MRRTMTFAKRNLIEVYRDPLSWIFCIAFPIVMLIIMSIVNSAIPKEGMTLFRIDNLSGGIAVFGQMFVMLFTAIAVAKDRNGAFLTRLYSSPMKSGNFVWGYILPMLLTAVIQVCVTLIASVVISLISGYQLSVAGLLLTIIAVIPSALMFSSIGFLFGTFFNEKAAPGICSIIISLGAMLGGIWFDVEGVGGFMYKLGKCLPFLYATKLARSAISLEFGVKEFLIPLGVVVFAALALTLLASIVFNSRMRADQR
ncbi:MAG: ABC transporter permease [Clostridiales bacterium]|nr:ABC transporter permease [Clostridiales bacterium]